MKTPCHRGGTCRELPSTGGGNSFTCICPSDTTGTLCEKNLKPPYDMPAFSGSSYIEVKKMKAYNKVQVK